MSDLMPVHQVLTVINRNSWKILEAAVDQIIVLLDTADAWIGVEAGNDGIGVLHKRHSEEVMAGLNQ